MVTTATVTLSDTLLWNTVHSVMLSETEIRRNPAHPLTVKVHRLARGCNTQTLITKLPTDTFANRHFPTDIHISSVALSHLF